MDIKDLTVQILAQIPPTSQFTPESTAAIARNRDFLLSLEPQLVAAFYDSLYAHPPTAGIFHSGERPDREETLRRWWRRTVGSPIEQSFWEWQTLVGIVHVRRHVSNAMMLAQWALIIDFVRSEAEKKLPPKEVAALAKAFTQLSFTAGALTAESYTRTYIEALNEVAGLEPALSERMVRMEVEELENKARRG